MTTDDDTMTPTDVNHYLARMRAIQESQISEAINDEDANLTAYDFLDRVGLPTTQRHRAAMLAMAFGVAPEPLLERLPVEPALWTDDR
jgi:hypothetical protein